MAIIQSYGLLWKADQVYWGKAGTLLGVKAKAKTSKPVDFRYQSGIYVLYSGHQIVYVGQTGAGERKRLFSRLKDHYNTDRLVGRWDAFSWFGLRRVLRNGDLSTEKQRAGATRKLALDHIEAVLIAAAEPTLNVKTGSFGKTAHKYLQFRDERFGPTSEEMLKQILRELE